MPGIGKPQDLAGANPFKQVTIKRKPVKASQAGDAKSRGEFLNEISGKENVGGGDVKFVDGKKQGKLGKDGFLKLLTHQLQNQDPFKPMDQNKFAADLAQFSQLEQMTNMNKNLEKSFNGEPMKAKFYAASFIGKKVVTAGATIKVNGMNDRPNLSFKLPANMHQGMVRIFDQKNQMIQQINMDALPRGLHQVQWNGKQLDGTPAGKGLYRFEVRAYDEMRNPIPVKTQATGVVQSVQFEDGEAVLTVDGKKVFLRDVQSFHLDNGDNAGHNKANNAKKSLPQGLQQLMEKQMQQPGQQRPDNAAAAQNAYRNTEGLAEY